MTGTRYAADSAISVVYALHHVRDVSLALDRVYAQGLTCEDVHDLVDDSSASAARLTLALEGADLHVRALEFDRAHAHTRTLRLIGQLDGDLTLTRDLITTLRRAHDLALERDRGIARGLDSAFYRARCLAFELEDACVRLHDVRRATGTATARVRHQPTRSARSAWWMAGWAVRVLPGAYRDRYAEEYAWELGELAARGATWRQQWDYALQVLFNALSLRRALPRPVNPPARDR